MKNEILVTGASGFIGRHLIRALEALGHSVRAHSRRAGDISNCALPTEGVSHVFHLAAKSFVPESWTSPQTFYNVNAMGTLNVLEHCRRTGTALTLISSYIYGQPQTLPIAEGHPLAAHNPYAHSKFLADELGRFYELHYGLRVVTVRPFNIYGPGQTPPFLIPSIVKQALDQSAPVIHVKDLRPRRDFLYVDDAVGMLVSTLSETAKGVYNLGSGESVSVAEIAQLVRQVARADKPIVSEDQPRVQEVMDVRADVSRAAADLGWRPSTPLAEGIARVVAAERAHA